MLFDLVESMIILERQDDNSSIYLHCFDWRFFTSFPFVNFSSYPFSVGASVRNSSNFGTWCTLQILQDLKKYIITRLRL